MRQTRHLFRYFLFFVIIQLITLSSLHLFKNQELDSFFSKRQIDIQGQYSLVTRSYQRRIQMGYEKTFSAPEVLALMEQAAGADTEERNRLRRELYNKFLPLYQVLLKYSFRQVHFHLNDGTSFLRMHLPELYGDQLAHIKMHDGKHKKKLRVPLSRSNRDIRLSSVLVPPYEDKREIRT